MSTTATQRRKARTPARKHGTAPIPPSQGEPRWFLDTDNDGHSFLVPVDLRTRWDLWIAQTLDEDSVCTPPPVGVRSIDGPHLLTFTDPREETP